MMLEPTGLLQNLVVFFVFCFLVTSYNKPLQHTTKCHMQHPVLRSDLLGVGQVALGVSQLANTSSQIISIGLCGSCVGLQSNAHSTDNREQQGRGSTAVSGNPQDIKKLWTGGMGKEQCCEEPCRGVYKQPWYNLVKLPVIYWKCSKNQFQSTVLGAIYLHNPLKN